MHEILGLQEVRVVGQHKAVPKAVPDERCLGVTFELVSTLLHKQHNMTST